MTCSHDESKLPDNIFLWCYIGNIYIYVLVSWLPDKDFDDDRIIDNIVDSYHIIDNFIAIHWHKIVQC